MITNGKPRPLGRGGGQNQTKYEDEDDSKRCHAVEAPSPGGPTNPHPRGTKHKHTKERHKNSRDNTVVGVSVCAHVRSAL